MMIGFQGTYKIDVLLKYPVEIFQINNCADGTEGCKE